MNWLDSTWQAVVAEAYVWIRPVGVHLTCGTWSTPAADGLVPVLVLVASQGTGMRIKHKDKRAGGWGGLCMRRLRDASGAPPCA